MFKVVSLKFAPEFDQGEEVIKAAGGELVRIPCQAGPQSSEEEIIAALSEADVAITMLQPFTRRVIESLPRLRAICVTGIGYDWIDVDAATENGVLVTNVPDFCLDEVADHALMLILALARKVIPGRQAVKDGWWDTPYPAKIHQQVLRPINRLRGQSLGLIGFGNIARNLAGKAQALGLKVMAHDTFQPPDLFRQLGVVQVELDHLLKASDFVSLHVPLNQKTRHLLGAAGLALMKPTAFLINTARGPVVEEEALCLALKEKRIAGAGLDVLELEPPRPDHPLFGLDNVIVTPHMGYLSLEAEKEGWLKPGLEAAWIIGGCWPRSIALVNPRAKDLYLQRWGPMREAET
ncbi:MAG: C-terminal binding protein [Thermodesulfobacteriota bacterium]